MPGGLTISNISPAFQPQGRFDVSESGYTGPFTASISDPTIATITPPVYGYGPGPATYQVLGLNTGVATITITDNHGGSESFQVSIDAAIVAVNFTFLDIYGNPLPPTIRTDFFIDSTSSDPGNAITSGYLGVTSGATFSLSLGTTYRIQYVGESAPILPSVYTVTGASSVTITPDGYISPWANLAGYAQIQSDELAPLGRFVSRQAMPSRQVDILFTTFASVFAQLDFFGRTNAAGERLLSSIDAQVDSWATDFLGATFLRNTAETNASYIARIISWLGMPFGTLAAINFAVQAWFKQNPDASTSVDVFDRQSDPVRSSRYALSPGQVAIVGYYPETDQNDGWFMGEQFMGEDTFMGGPYDFFSSLTPPYAGLDVQVNRVKAGGIVPVYIASRGEP